MQGEHECIDVSLIIFLKSFSVTIEQQHKSYFACFLCQKQYFSTQSNTKY